VRRLQRGGHRGGTKPWGPAGVRIHPGHHRRARSSSTEGQRSEAGGGSDDDDDDDDDDEDEDDSNESSERGESPMPSPHARRSRGVAYPQLPVSVERVARAIEQVCIHPFSQQLNNNLNNYY